MALYFLVDIHDLFDGSIKSGEQHVTDNQKSDPGVNVIPDDIQERFRRQHALDEDFLLSFLSRRQNERPVFFRIDVLPGEVILIRGCDTAEISLVTTGANHDLVEVEQSGFPLTQPASAVSIR